MLNSEKYKTSKDRARAYDEFCSSRSCNNCELNNHTNGDYTVDVCMAFWLDMEAEEEKIEDCPYCGGKCYIWNDEDGRYRVVCHADLSCKYSSSTYTTEHEAVAKHNRVARAVAGKKVANER